MRRKLVGDSVRFLKFRLTNDHSSLISLLLNSLIFTKSPRMSLKTALQNKRWDKVGEKRNSSHLSNYHDSPHLDS